VVRVWIELSHRVPVHHVDMRILTRANRKMPSHSLGIFQVGQNHRSTRAQIFVRPVFRRLIEHFKVVSHRQLPVGG